MTEKRRSPENSTVHVGREVNPDANTSFHHFSKSIRTLLLLAMTSVGAVQAQEVTHALQSNTVRPWNSLLECSLSPSDPPPSEVSEIGNSLTYWVDGRIDIPGLFNRMLQRKRGSNENISDCISCGEGAALSDHLKYLQWKICLNTPILILQEIGGRELSRNREKFVESLRTFSQEVNGRSRMILYQTPNRKSRSEKDNMMSNSISDSSNSFYKIAEKEKVEVIPVGIVFEQAQKLVPDISLYQDEVHPSPEGAYLAAAVFYVFYTGENPVTMGGLGYIDDTTARRLGEIAWTTTPLAKAFIDWKNTVSEY